MTSLPTYSSKQVNITFLDHNVQGLGPDSFVEFELNSPLTSYQVGSDGSVSISVSPDETGLVRITLLQNSSTNNYLAGILEVQRRQGALVKGSFTIKDPSGSVVALMRGAHIMEAPQIILGSSTEGGERVWTFFIEQMDFISVPEGISDEVSEIVDVAANLDNINEFIQALI